MIDLSKFIKNQNDLNLVKQQLSIPDQVYLFQVLAPHMPAIMGQTDNTNQKALPHDKKELLAYITEVESEEAATQKQASETVKKVDSPTSPKHRHGLFDKTTVPVNTPASNPIIGMRKTN